MGKALEHVEGWDGVDEFIGAGDLTVLSDDGESVLFMVVGAPVGITSRKFKTESKRALVPILTADGLSVIPVGARVYRKLTRQRDKFSSHAVLMTRHGKAGDTETSYAVEMVELPDDLKDLRKKVQVPEIAAVVKASLEILQD